MSAIDRLGVLVLVLASCPSIGDVWAQSTTFPMVVYRFRSERLADRPDSSRYALLVGRPGTLWVETTAQGPNRFDREAQLGVANRRPWWQTWWFRLLAAGIMVGLLAAAHRYRVRHLLQMQRMRLRIASDLHDDVGSNLSSIALLSEMLHEHGLHGEEQQHQLRKIHRAADETMRTLRDIIWFIDPQHDRLGDMVGKMRDEAADMLNGTRYQFEAPQRTNGEGLSMEFRRHVFLIYKEALHNVVQHAEAEEVNIRVERQHGTFELEVQDDGCGFDEESEPGHGLRNMRRRAARIGGRLRVDSTPGEGTAISVSAKIA